jgi:hypothetical protein
LAGPVDVEVEPEVEEVLVDRGVQPVRVEELAVARRLTGGHRPRREDAGQLDLALDAAVLVEVPEDPVVVVADRRERRDDQPARPADVRPAGPHVLVPPERAVVLLVHADGVLHLERRAVLVDQRGVEVADLAEAVAPEGQRVDQRPEVQLAAVVGVLPAVGGGRIAVGDDHLGHGGAVEDGTDPAALLPADGVQHQPLAGGEADAQPPVLPADERAVDPRSSVPPVG